MAQKIEFMMLKKRNNVLNYALRANDRYKARSIDFCDKKKSIVISFLIDISVAHLVYKILVKFCQLRSGQNWIQLDINLVDHSN